MTTTEINTKITQLTGADTFNGYLTAMRLIDVNLWQHKILTMIMGSQDEGDFDDQRNTTFPIKTTPLVANQRDYGIAVSEKVIAIKRVDISWDGQTYYRAEPIDSGEIEMGIGPAGSTQETTLDGRFSRNAPRYDTKGLSVLIYPRATQAEVNAGAKVRIEWVREMTEITAFDSTVPGFDSAFQPMLAYGPSFEYCNANNLPQAKSLWAVLQDYESRLKQIYGSKQKDRDYQIRAAVQNYK